MKKSIENTIVLASLGITGLFFYGLYIGSLGGLSLSIDESGTTIAIKRQIHLSSIGITVIWEKGSDDMIWAISGVAGHIDNLKYGKAPEPYRTEAGFIDAMGRQFFPKQGKIPVPLSLNKEYYLYVETVINTPVGRGLSEIGYKIFEDEGKFILKRTRISPEEFPECIKNIWYEISEPVE